jgi:hypothetical protein
MGTWTKKTVDLMEGKVGRVRIDFDRMVGDTTATCEALANGLTEVRSGIRGVESEVRQYGLGAQVQQQQQQYQPFYGMSR